MNSKCKTVFLVIFGVSLLATSLFVYPVAAQYGPKAQNLIIHIYLNPDAENQEIDTGLIDINDWPLAKEWVDRWALNPDITMRSYIDIG
ncbi:MAG: hypothetical protein O2U62_05810, partial [Candidatus Bathyarchaeota archaeon]|nr:hypothetical protein [Candidatus Bathyarchaeota archaeon]